MKQYSQLIQEWCDEIDIITKLVLESYGNIPNEKLNLKGNGGSWSIAENLKHIIVVNSSYFPLINRLLKSSEPKSRQWMKKIIAKMVGPWLLKKVSRNRKDKIKTFSIWEPGDVNDATDIIRSFKEQQEQVKTYIKRSISLLESECIISSPANSAIMYRLEDAYRILIEHEWRHIHQINETQHINTSAGRHA